MAAPKVVITLSISQADALLKTIATAPKQTKTVEALVAKITEAKTKAESEATA